jgi:hypothetical protein
LNPRVPDVRFRQVTNLSLTKLKKTNSYDVGFHVTKLKHTMSEPLSVLYVIFEGYESAKSFHVDYSLIAANMPIAYESGLDIIVEK